MREVNYITVRDHTRTIIIDFMVGKRPAALITTFFTKRGRKGNLYFVDIYLTKCALFSKLISKFFAARFASGKVLPPHSINPSYALVMPPTKICPQCTAAVPVRWKTCERCDHVFQSKRKAECNSSHMHCCAEGLALQCLSLYYKHRLLVGKTVLSIISYI